MVPVRACRLSRLCLIAAQFGEVPRFSRGCGPRRADVGPARARADRRHLASETGEAGDDTRAGRVRTAESSSTGAIGLSGLARTDDGEWRVFSFIENGATADPTGTKDAMDGPAATVNGCWA
ncbi:hypothetical protein Shyhy01_21740 [Streptomyces hygroscopicus subsp. hygroscopicus]|nr:D-alanyl-D-alanine carboxypeptidase [Streptomyces hygroscopicus]GLX49224.1 hypothetical protein Shyhy01_21740 [Streptomyces hygroscopicus subsp. hygroscopicus]